MGRPRQGDVGAVGAKTETRRTMAWPERWSNPSSRRHCQPRHPGAGGMGCLMPGAFTPLLLTQLRSTASFAGIPPAAPARGQCPCGVSPASQAVRIARIWRARSEHRRRDCTDAGFHARPPSVAGGQVLPLRDMRSVRFALAAGPTESEIYSVRPRGLEWLLR